MSWTKEVTFVVFAARHTKVFNYSTSNEDILAYIKEIWHTGYVETIKTIYEGTVTETLVINQRWDKPNTQEYEPSNTE